MASRRDITEAILRIRGDSTGAVAALRQVDRQVSATGKTVRKETDALRAFSRLRGFAAGTGVLTAGRILSGAASRAVDWSQGLQQLKTVLKVPDGEFDAFAFQLEGLKDLLSANGIEEEALMGLLLDLGRQVKALGGELPTVGKLSSVFRAAFNLAHATGSDFAETLHSLVTIMASYKRPAEDAAETTDILLRTLQNSVLELPQIADAVRDLGPAAVEARVPFSDLLTTLAVVGDSAAGGISLATALKKEAMEGNQAAIDLLQKIGVLREGQNPSEVPILDLLDALKRKLDTGEVDAGELQTALGQMVPDSAKKSLDEIIGKLERIRDLRLELAGDGSTSSTAEGAAAETGQGWRGRVDAVRQARIARHKAQLDADRERQFRDGVGWKEDDLRDPEVYKRYLAAIESNDSAAAYVIGTWDFSIDWLRKMVGLSSGGVARREGIYRIAEAGQPELVAPQRNVERVLGRRLTPEEMAREFGVPMLEKGGRLDRAGIYLGGEAGTEYVLPEDYVDRMLATPSPLPADFMASRRAEVAGAAPSTGRAPPSGAPGRGDTHIHLSGPITIHSQATDAKGLLRELEREARYFQLSGRRSG